MQPNVNQQTNVTTVTQAEKNHHAREVSHHLWAFFVSIALTALAFIATWTGMIENTVLLGMFLLVLAIVQAMFQLFVWMHLNQKGHEIPVLFIFSGVFVAILTVAALMLLIHW